MNDDHATAVRLAVHRFLGDGRWHTTADLWAQLKKEDNPADSVGDIKIVLDAMRIHGIVEERIGLSLHEYRLTPIAQ
jgi:hypothetical protein